MALLWIKNVSLSFGGPLLFDSASLQIEPGERIGLLGRNGAGKSTLLGLLSGAIRPDAGEIVLDRNIRIGLMPQHIEDLPGSVYDVVADGGREHLDLLHEYSELSSRLPSGGDKQLLKKIEQVQHRLEAAGAWHFSGQVQKVLDRAALDAKAHFQTLSAGLKRRALLARALVSDPDILLLDEPTNHLDIDSILWLETFLQNFPGTLLFVTHDRMFLQKIATRIVEIDRGKLFSYACGYAAYLERRQALLDAEEKQWQTFDRKLAGEEAWIHQGIKARRTRNEGRVRALLAMREERARRREREGRVRFSVAQAAAGGKLVAEIRNIRFAYGDKKIIDGFSTRIMRGDRVGIIGPNGSGKTTLLKVLLGELPVPEGEVRLGANITAAYFDQLRAQLEDAKSIRDNIADGNDTVVINGAARHVVGYLQEFLFPPAQISAPVSSLSGGERNRLLLARLFCRPSNVLVLDEPTNDLDAETLELLEDRLLDYSGTILLVSHDRTFLNNVVTSTIVLEGGGRLEEYVGGYDDWLRQRGTPAAQTAAVKSRKEKPPKEKSKLSFRETRELAELPQSIEALEKEKAQLVALLTSPEFYRTSDRKHAEQVHARLAQMDAELEEGYRRWDELEQMAAKFAGNPPPDGKN
ncbi:MAG: ATP-binding cassette domain-containing protein [Deltaproteobacteria bacterium]